MEVVIEELVEEVCRLDERDVERTKQVVSRVLQVKSGVELALAVSADPHAAPHRVLGTSAARLAALSDELLASVERSSGGATRVENPQAAGFRLAHPKLVCASVVADLCVVKAVELGSQMSEEGWQCICSLASLALGPGRAALATAFDSLSLSQGAAPAAAARLMLETQAALMRVLTEVVQQRLGDPAAFAERVARPQPLLAWMAAAACVADSLRGPQLSIAAKNSQADMMASICTLFDLDEFQDHREALGRDPVVQASLLRVQLPALQVAAVALQLPPDRRPAWFNWQKLSMRLGALSDSKMRDGLRLLAAPTHGGISSTGWRLLQDGAQLLAALPGDSRPDSLTKLEHAALWFFAGQLLGSVCGSTTAAAMDQQQRQQAAGLLRQAVVRLPHVLQGLEERAAQTDAEECGCWCQVCHLLQDLVDPRSGEHPEVGAFTVASLADVPAWCTAASEALRALPQVAALAAATQQQQLAGHPSVLTSHMVAVAVAVARMCSRLPSSADGADQTSVAAASTALWQLHTAACRAVYWLLAGGGQEAWPGDAFSRLLCPQLTHVLSPCFVAIADLPTGVSVDDLQPGPAGTQQGPADGTSHGEQCAEPITRAVGVAQLEIVVALMLRHADAQPDCAALGAGHRECAEAASNVVQALRWAGPAALVQSEPLQRCLRALLERTDAAQDAPGEVPVSALVLLQAYPLPKDGVLAAWLVDCGAVDAALRRLASWAAVCAPDTSSAIQTNFAMRLAVHSIIIAVLDGLRGLPQSAAADELQRDIAVLEAVAPPRDSLQQPVPAETFLGLQRNLLPPARRLAAALLDWHRQPQQLAGVRLEVARAAAARSCAYLRCANLGLEGGPGAGEGSGCKRCSACRAIWYCGTDCSHADWRAGHRRVCKKLAEERQRARQQAEERQRARQQAEEGQEQQQRC